MHFSVTMTLGPASGEPGTRQRLLAAADRFRLNTSFYNPLQVNELLQQLAELFQRNGRLLPVVLDLQGSKMRIGEYPALAGLPSPVTLACAPASTKPEVIPVPHRELFAQVQPGDCLLLNDARILLEVIAVKGDELAAGVIKNGPLSRFKSINRKEHPLVFDRLREEDEAVVNAGKDFPFVQYAYSFVHTGQEAGFLRRLTDKKIIAKIERPEAFPYLKEIAAGFAELWLCRGDLGAQAGLPALAGLQKEFGCTCRSLAVETMLAGQVLEYMTHFPEPTRAEVVQLYDALAAGFGGFVLSDETAIGKCPEQVADFIDSLRR